jgi:methyl-accepting chemotaxis protein
LEPVGKVRISRLFLKTLFSIVFLLAIFALSTILYFSFQLRTQLIAEFESKGRAIADSIASSGTEILLNRDASTIQAVVDQYQQISGVGYVFVVDANREIIAHTFVPAIPPETNLLIHDQARIRRRDIQIAGQGDYVDVSTPILAGAAGYVHVGMDLGAIYKHLQTVIRDEVSLVILLFLISILVAYFLARSIARPIQAAARAAEAVARGNLDIDIHAVSKDETGQLTNSVRTMIQNLNSIVSQVQNAGIQVLSMATKISATSKDQEAAVNDFRVSASEISATARTISATSRDLAQNMMEISKVSGETGELAGTGKSGLSAMENNMGRLVAASQSISSYFGELNEKAERVNAIVAAITKVADQTNLLSLNASIEAEKAGQYGLGFGVVAEEIRRLADQTAVSSLDIEKTVTEMRSAVSKGVRSTDEFSQSVESSAERMTDISSQLSLIIEKIEALTPRFESASEGTQSQAEAAHQISEAMSHLSEAAEKTAETVDEFRKITDQLQKAVRGLQQEVSRIKVSK